MGQLKHQLLMPAAATALFAGLLVMAAAPALAQVPSGGQVVAGTATITNVDPHQQRITQTTDKAIINWQNFSIGAGDGVQFVQPSSSSIILNRVVGADVSNIFGRLTANGQVFLVNPNGIYFGNGASLDVGGLVATTFNIRDDDFLAGRYVFNREGSSTTRADVINDGVLKARQGGYVVLAGDYAANRGVIEAKLGTVLLGSAQQITLDINGDSLISYALNERNLTALAGVANSGQLLADGGRVVMTASTARTLANSAVNNSGVIQALGVDEHDGAVYLLSDGGAITVDGTSRIDVSGDKGGGHVLIGGNFHGAGTEAHADAVVIASGARIKADALVSGNGGNVAVWSDGGTSYKGSISARGGAQAGNGGFVEVSGKKLGFAGTVDTTAAKGKMGTLLLDPADITISNNADFEITTATPFGDDLSDGGTSNLNVTTLQTALGSTNVTVSTATTSGGNAGNITVQDAVSWSNTTLSLISNGQTIINAALTGTNGGLNIVAGNGVSQSAAISVSVLGLYGTGSFNLNGTTNNVDTLAANLNGSLSFKNAGALNIGSVNIPTVGSTSGINVGSTHTVTLDVGGDLSQDAGADFHTGGLKVVSSSGTVALNNAGNNAGVFAASTNGAISYQDGSNLTIGSVNGTNGINSTGNNITVNAAGTLTVSQAITASGNAVTRLGSGGATALNAAYNGTLASTGALIINSGNGVTGSGVITAAGLKLTGNGLFDLSTANNFIATAAANVTGGGVKIRNGGALLISTVDGTNGINTNGGSLWLNVQGLGQSAGANVNTGTLEVFSGAQVGLANSGNTINQVAIDANGTLDLGNSSATLYVQQVGGTTGINTHGNDLTLNTSGTLWLGYAGANGTVNVGGGIADITVDYLYQGANAPLIADQLAARATHFFGIRGNNNNSINTLAVNITGGTTSGYVFDIGNNTSITVGSVNGISGITTNGGDVLVSANGNITMNNDVKLATGVQPPTGKLALISTNNGNIDLQSRTYNVFGLGMQGGSVSDLDTSDTSTVKLLAANLQSEFHYTTTHELTIGDVLGIKGISATGDVYLKTGTFGASGSIPAFSATRPYTDYVDTATNKARAGLMIEEQIKASGHKVYLNSDSGIFQWSSDNSTSPATVRNNAAITADALLIYGTGNFDMSLGKNAVNHLAADVNGSFSFVTGGPLTIDQQTFNQAYGGSIGTINKTISGVNTRADTLISGSVAGGDAQYNQHNILIAASDDPNSGSNVALTINKSIVADSKGSSAINLSVGASTTHTDALVKTDPNNSSVVVQGSTLILGAAKDKGAFNIRTNIKSLSAAGGKYMQIDNSAYTGQLTVLGIGTSQGGGAPTPVGDFYLTTAGSMVLLGGKSEGNYLQLRTDNLSLFGTMDMKDGARVLLQPYHMSNNVGIHNAYDSFYGSGWAQTNYTRSTLLQFSQTATIYVGSTPALMNQDASVPTQVKNLKLTGAIHIAGDKDTGLKMGYRSLSAESSNSIFAEPLGDVYNLRLVAPTVTVRGFNATGDQVDLVADTLSLPYAKSFYTLPNHATVLLEPYTTSKSMWIGWIEPGYAASEVNYSFDTLDKLDSGTAGTIIFSGTTDAAYNGAYLRLAHSELSPPYTTHYHNLNSQLILSTTGIVDTSLGTFNNAFPFFGSAFSLQNWNAANGTLPFVNRIESQGTFSYTALWQQDAARSNWNTTSAYSTPATLHGFGQAGGTWGGCANLSTCTGTNPSTPTGPTGLPVLCTGPTCNNNSTPTVCTGAGCSNNNTNQNNNLPPAGPSNDPTNNTNNNAVNTPGNNNNNGNNNSNSGNTPSGFGDPDGGGPNDGMSDGGPSGGGGGPGGGGGGNGGGSNDSSGNSSGNSSNGSGNNGSGNGSGSGGGGSGNGTDGGDDSGLGSGSGNGGGGNGSNDGGNSLSGSGGGSGNGGNSSDGSGSGSGSNGSGNGGGDSGGNGGGSGSGSGGGSSGNGDSGAGDGSGSSGAGSGGDGNGTGNGGGGGGSGGAGDSGDGGGSGSGGSGNGGGSGSGSGGGSSGGGDSGSGDGGGSSGAGSGGDGNGTGAGGSGGSGGAGDSGDGGSSGSGSGGNGGGSGGSGSGSGGGSSGSGDSGDGGGTSGKGGNGGGDSGDGSGAGAGNSGSGSSAGDDSDGSGAGSGKGGSGGTQSEGENGSSGSGGAAGASGGDDSGTSAGSGKGGNGGSDSGDGSGAGSKNGGSGEGDDSESGNGSGSGKDGNGGGKTSDASSAENGGGQDSGDGSSDGSAAEGADGTANSSGGGSGGGSSASDSSEHQCFNSSGSNRGQDLPEQGGPLASRPLLEVRGGGVNMERDCSKKQAPVAAKGR